MLSFLDREDLIVLINCKIRESVIKREFDVSDEEYNSLLNSIDIRKKLQNILKQKDSTSLQKLIKKYRKKDCLVEYVACFVENKDEEFLNGLDSVSRERFKVLLEEYEISLDRKPKVRDNSKSENQDKIDEKTTEKDEEYRLRVSTRSLSDAEIAEFREKAEKGNINQKNIFAFMLYKSGRIDEARDYLLDLIDAHKSYIAFRQLIHLEKTEGNLDDAKMWTEEAEEQFPNNLGLKEVKFRIARQEKDIKGMLSIAKEIRELSPDAEKYEKEAIRYKERIEEK